MKKSFLATLCCLLLQMYGPQPLYAEAPSFGYGGYVRNFFVFSEYSNDSDAVLNSRLRIRLDYRYSDSLSGEIAYELIPLIGDIDNDPFGPGLPSDPFSYRVIDLDRRIYPGDDDTDGSFALLQNLDRVFITYSPEQIDLYVGRQVIAFGSARVINPTDIIAPFTYDTISKDERIGVDAVRLRVPTAQLGEFDIGHVFGEDFKYEESASYVRVKSYIFMTDTTVMAIPFRGNLLLGLDLARSIGGAGAWLEAAYVFSEEGSDEDYFRLSVGSDYSFTEKFYGYLEYHYNGAGETEPEQYFSSIGKTAYTDGAVYLLAQHYVAPGFSYQFTPLLVFSGHALINVNDGSILASPVFEYSFADDLTSELGAYIGVGAESSNPLIPESEFGLYPDTYFVSLNYYF